MKAHVSASPRQVAQVPPIAAAESRVLQRKCACGGSPGPSGECEACRKKRLQRKSGHAAEPSGVPSIVYDVLRSAGQPLDSGTRAFFEPRFGHDFSQVRVHTDTDAAESANAVNALAYTVGPHIVFGPGEFQPDRATGQRLLAHELVHTIQQGSDAASDSDVSMSDPSGSPEVEANNLADAVVRNSVDGPARASVSSAPRRLQRAPRPNERNGGCGICTSAAVTGTFAHTAVQFMFGLTHGRRAIIPEAPFFNPDDAENGRLDLMRMIQTGTPPTDIEIGEIKPDNDQGRRDGTRDLAFYLRQVQAMFPAPMYRVTFMTLDPPQVSVPFTDAPLSQCPFQELTVRGPRLGGQPGLYFYSCTPPGSQINKQCCGATVPVPVTSGADEKSKEKQANGGQVPVTSPILQPSMAKQIVEFVRALIKSGAEVTVAVDQFLRAHPEIISYLYAAALGIFLANIVEDIITLGAGLVDEPIVIAICLAMVKAAHALRAAGTVPALP